ncbi:MAG: cell division protein ZapE [Rubrimonas sp.]|uniref:cell division protein ZapE n=1 Tax=Rubrimonas sp. TaxID=2036015 RepID=UPI002FDDBA03
MTPPDETSPDSAPDGPMRRYRALIAEGRIVPDEGQRAAVGKLQLLHQRLVGYEPRSPRKAARGLLGFGRKAAKPDAPVGGLYLFGEVGRGKSMLMDVFFETATVSPRRRVHFHAFMQEVHAGMRDARSRGESDPLAPVVARIAEAATLLCFDEVTVTDITDAMILGRLFEGLFARGVVVVATSNRPPDDLYKDGLNRGLFLPFIAMLKDRLDLCALQGPTDHRQRGPRDSRRWLSPLGPRTDAAMDEIWRDIKDGAPETPLVLHAHGRTLRLPRHAAGAVRASFDDLCARALGPADFLALAGAARLLALERVPKLGPGRANEAKRLATLVDALYEARATLIVSAEAEPGTLYAEGAQAFEFARTASRLTEMRSQAWPPG